MATVHTFAERVSLAHAHVYTTMSCALGRRSCFYKMRARCVRGSSVKRHSGGINYVQRCHFGLQISVSTCSLKTPLDEYKSCVLSAHLDDNIIIWLSFDALRAVSFVGIDDGYILCIISLSRLAYNI